MKSENVAECIVDMVLDNCEGYRMKPRTYIRVVKEIAEFIEEETGLLS